MSRPYTVLHMLISLDGKITGDFLSTKVGAALCEEYYRIHRSYKADAFLCGRVTMEGSFTGGGEPPLEAFQGLCIKQEDHVARKSAFYAVAVDPHGRLGWSDSEIHDEDPGYDGAHIIEVLTEAVGDAYLAFLQSRGISYIFCGKERVDVSLMQQKLHTLFGIKRLLVEGGGMTDSLFLEKGEIDECSLVLAPLVDGGEGIELFAKKQRGSASFTTLKTAKLPHAGLWLNYKR